MSASGFRPSVDTQWKALYRAAMFETDGEILRSLLDGAEGAVIARGRELLYATGYKTEEERVGFGGCAVYSARLPKRMSARQCCLTVRSEETVRLKRLRREYCLADVKDGKTPTTRMTHRFDRHYLKRELIQTGR